MDSRSTETPDPRSRLHRACIHVGWWGLFVVVASVLWANSTSLIHGKWWAGVAVAAVTTVLAFLNIGLFWAIHKTPPGQRISTWLGDR